MKFKLYICIRADTPNFLFFSKLKGHNYVKHHQIETKFQLDLYFLVNNIHMKYQLYMCIPSKVREQKL